jgi:hypothetical protein
VAFDLFRRRTVWLPTWKGWLLLFIVLAGPLLGWAWRGEAYLAHTERAVADTLVIESWIQEDGLHAAAEEYRAGGYRHLVVTGGLTGSKGTLRRRSYAAVAEKALLEAGIPKDVLIPAPIPDVETQRTHTMATGVRQALEGQAVKPSGINVFTEGAHARRSRLVFARVFGPDTRVGVISWAPAEHRKGRPFWTSSQRTIVFLKETLGYPYELLFHSGRDN